MGEWLNTKTVQLQESRIQVKDAMPYCPKCGGKTREDMSFCPKCGASLKERAAVAAPVAPPPPSAPVRVEKEEKREKEEKEEKHEKEEKEERLEKREFAFVGPLIGGLVLILLGFGFYLILTTTISWGTIGAIMFVIIGIIVIAGAAYAAMVAARRHPPS